MTVPRGQLLFALVIALSLPTLANAQGQQQDRAPVSDIGGVNAEAAAKAFPKRGFSPYANRNYPTRVFWGDQHVHTGWSADAGTPSIRSVETGKNRRQHLG